MNAKQKRHNEAVMECYRRLFKNSTPEGDFDMLLETATINENGEKVIPFNDYEIDHTLLLSIIEDCIKEYKIKPAYNAEAFRFTILLGCSPKSKNI